MQGLPRLFQLLLVEQLPITLVVGLGLAAIYLLLPRPRAYPVLWGAAAGGAALLIGGGLLVRAGAFTPETLLFYLFSAAAIVAATLLITQQNPARAVLAFALVVLSTCGLFLLLAAPFLMAATIIVYAGAIVVTFLFVLMLAQQEGLSNADQRSREPFLASLAGFLLLGALLYALGQAYQNRPLDDRLHQVQKYLEEVRALSSDQGQSSKDIQSLAENLENFLKEFLEGERKSETEWKVLPAEALGDKALAQAVHDARNHLLSDKDRPLDREPLEKALVEVLKIGQAASFKSKTFPPQNEKRFGGGLSNLSGPAPNQELRLDQQGRPELPAENVAYLGRSLFTDYLVAVELAGTLLLVATIGAIAIAQRRPEGSR